MTPAPSTAATGPTDTRAQGPLLLLLGSALCWLVVSGVLSLVATIQLHTPGFLSACAWLTYGHMQALAESSFLYGWAANAAFAAAIWLLARLGGAPLRALGLLTVGTLFWNLALTIGLVCILFGEATGVPFLQMPAYIHPLLLFSCAAISTPGILAWTGRRQKATFATQWYAVAALFLFPWLYSLAQVMLLRAPVRGVAQAVVMAWFSQNLLTLWLVPITLAAAYYLVPKLSGRRVANYDFAPHAFWTLLFCGAWSGTRVLLGGPVPAWIPAMGIVTTCILLFHYAIVALNLREALGGGRGNPVFSFVSFGLFAYLLSGLVNAFCSFQFAAELVQYTYFPVAQLKLVLVGAFSLPVFAVIYTMVPLITGVSWPSSGLIRAHLGLALLGLVAGVLGLALAGWVQGHELLNPAVPFTAIAAATRPWLSVAIVGDALWLLGSLVLLLHFIRVHVAVVYSTFVAAPVAAEAVAS